MGRLTSTSAVRVAARHLRADSRGAILKRAIEDAKAAETVSPEAFAQASARAYDQALGLYGTALMEAAGAIETLLEANREWKAARVLANRAFTTPTGYFALLKRSSGGKPWYPALEKVFTAISARYPIPSAEEKVVREALLRPSEALENLARKVPAMLQFLDEYPEALSIQTKARDQHRVCGEAWEEVRAQIAALQPFTELTKLGVEVPFDFVHTIGRIRGVQDESSSPWGKVLAEPGQISWFEESAKAMEDLAKQRMKYWVD
jgi:hypothetical protein